MLTYCTPYLLEVEMSESDENAPPASSSAHASVRAADVAAWTARRAPRPVSSVGVGGGRSSSTPSTPESQSKTRGRPEQGRGNAKKRAKRSKSPKRASAAVTSLSSAPEYGQADAARIFRNSSVTSALRVTC